MTTGPFNKDIQAKSGEPLKKYWVNLCAKIDACVWAESKERAKALASEYMSDFATRRWWDCETEINEVTEDE